MVPEGAPRAAELVTGSTPFTLRKLSFSNSRKGHVEAPAAEAPAAAPQTGIKKPGSTAVRLIRKISFDFERRTPVRPPRSDDGKASDGVLAGRKISFGRSPLAPRRPSFGRSPLSRRASSTPGLTPSTEEAMAPAASEAAPEFEAAPEYNIEVQEYNIEVTNRMTPKTKIRVPIPGVSPGVVEKVVISIPANVRLGQIISFSLPCNWADVRRRYREDNECEDAALVAELEAEFVRVRSKQLDGLQTDVG